MCIHLAKCGSRYSFRRRIPLALIPYVQRTEIVQALGTSNRSEAGRWADWKVAAGKTNSLACKGRPSRRACPIV
ncbi:DUF6538 domain-containing protein [Serratia sp. (in: enterobacteria)]|uniref:DUF6538 domain-containing protein n=1 Tax=Serratia sp. (in: enterobacteria) TaxID=616 RepID=UPI00398A1420